MRHFIKFLFVSMRLLMGMLTSKGEVPQNSFMQLRGWYAPGNGFQYKLTSKVMTYIQARDECQGYGGHLAYHGIRDRFYFPLLSEHFAMSAWVGVDDLKQEGNFYWADKRPVKKGWNGAWTFLQPDDQVDEDCTIITNQPCKYSRRGLDDVACERKYFGLCEKSLGKPPLYPSVAINGTQFALITSETNYNLAKQECQLWGGKLAEQPVTNPKLAESLVQHLYKDEGIRSMNSWIGLNDVETEGDLLLDTKDIFNAGNINWQTRANSQKYDCGTFSPLNLGTISLHSCEEMFTILCEKSTSSSGQEQPSQCFSQSEECQLSGHRTIEGNCNNLLNEDRGRVKRPFKRMLPPSYDDGLGIPRGGFPSRLKSPREIVTTLNDSTELPSEFASHHLPLWGQLLAHDLTKLGELKAFSGELLLPCPCGDPNPECFNIPIPDGDPVREQMECYSFTRAEKVPDINCDSTVREQENRVTSYIDASNIYGSNHLFFSHLRGENGAFLIGNHTDNHYQQLPLGDQVPNHMHSQFECEHIHFLATSLPCMAAGDIRVNEQAALASGHTVWMRKHNQIAKSLIELNPHWDSDKTFYVTRSIIAAIHQHITYNEFFPIVLGETNMKRFGLQLNKKGFYYGYDPLYDSSIDISFATAAFRLGHTLINGILSRFSRHYSENPRYPPIDLRTQFFDPTSMYDDEGVGSVLRGMVTDDAMNFDTQFADALTNHLFAEPGKFGRDLISLNIQRGRDHGIPSYMEHRRFCGLSTTSDCRKMEDIPENVREKLCNLYDSTEDIDLFVGGISEVPRDELQGVPGPTFACLIAYQARDLKKGDSFWYENGGPGAKFTYSQLQAIKRVTLSRVLCDVGENMTQIQPKAMLQHTMSGNERVHCSDIQELDLSPFEEGETGYVDTEPDEGNDEEDFEWTEWFPYSISSKTEVPLKVAPTLLHHLQVYRPHDVCINVIGTASRIVNGFYQVRYKCYPGTIRANDFPPVDSKEVYWTKWSNQTTPSAPHFDDDETIVGSATCLYPVSIQAQTVVGVPARETGDVFEMISPSHGLVCKGIHQPSRMCQDYRIRFLCLQD